MPNVGSGIFVGPMTDKVLEHLCNEAYWNCEDTRKSQYRLGQEQESEYRQITEEVNEVYLLDKLFSFVRFF